MAGLAQVLIQGGWVVTGSEPAPGPAVARLRRLGVGIRLHAGHATGPCPRSAHWLICGPGAGRTDRVRLSAERRGVAVTSLLHCHEALLRRGIGLVVCGGRAARGAAAMIGWTLTCAGRDPTVVLGAAAPQLGGWGRLGAGAAIVVEAIPDADPRGGPGAVEDWGRLAPRLALLLDDETDAGSGSASRGAALEALTASVPRDGLVLARAGGASAPAALRQRARGVPVEWLALERGADWWGADLRNHRGRYRFRAFHRGRFVTEVALQVPGKWHVLGALAAVAACGRLDIPAREIHRALEDFAGISRDFESRGSYRGVTLIDDAGDDPAAVAAALRLGRCIFGARRIWAVLHEPGRALTAAARDRYPAALALADEVVLAAGPGTAGALAAALAAAGVRHRGVTGLDAAIWELDRHLEPGDVLVTLGAGDVGMISDAFIRRLPRHRPGR